MKYDVMLQSRKMGGFCKSCVQNYAFEVEASSNEEAVSKAKEASGLNLDYYKINILYVRISK
ncbi:hypothetical protein RCIP0073_00080 [Klebsiella phage RCIP0073]|nr:hypothetical protein KMI8_77 [Klebsiella phage KMI8]UCR74545.1 hypothetical protein KL3_00080 [Klebsiella phage KL3]